ncbi:MAG: DUF2171 domain-containing protein [Deltaproteobacteria bacterium]|nr:DUF2171 domain-containing protein [Deltaproteobacteria bacterium]
MEVLSSDGKHVGTVDHLDGPDKIKLTKSDPQSGGEHHLIPLDWIDHIDAHVHLSKSARDVMTKWQKAA